MNIIKNCLNDVGIIPELHQTILSYANIKHPVAEIFEDSVFYRAMNLYNIEPHQLLSPIDDETYFVLIAYIQESSGLNNIRRVCIYL